MNTSTRQLQAFLAIARLGSFTRAAEEIFVTQAGLSLMLKDLESQLGARLFDRTTRSVNLTPAGKALLPTVRGMIADWERATSNIGQMSALSGQRLELAATPLIAASILPEWLHEFHEVQPNVQVNVSDIDRRMILQGIEAGEIDLGIGAFFKPATGIERRLLATFQMVMVCQSTNRRATRKRQQEYVSTRYARWDEFNGQRLLSLPDDNPIQQLVTGNLRHYNTPLGRGGALHNIQTIIAMVESGHGVAALPSFVISACERYNVIAHPLIDPIVQVEFYAVTKKGREKTETIEKLIDSIERHFRTLSEIASI